MRNINRHRSPSLVQVVDSHHAFFTGGSCSFSYDSRSRVRVEHGAFASFTIILALAGEDRPPMSHGGATQPGRIDFLETDHHLLRIYLTGDFGTERKFITRLFGS